MEDRIIRAIMAENPVPMAIDGRIRWLNHGQNPAESGSYPMAGNHCRFAAKTIIKRIANQKSGIDRPRKANSENAVSAALFLRVAEMMPAGTAMTMAMMKDSKASDRVLGNAFNRMSLTGWF